MTNLSLFAGLNYSDRIIETRLVSPQDFINAGYRLVATVQNVDFNPNDGIITEHLIDYNNNNEEIKLLFAGVQEPAYLVAESYYEGGIQDISCWWVMDGSRTRLGQFKLDLLRDIVHDYANVLLNSTVFVEKGTVNANSPLVFNKENITVNEIKTEEYLFKDQTATPWLVGYIAKNTNLQGTVPKQMPGTITLTTPISEWEFSRYTYESPAAGPATITQISFPVQDMVQSTYKFQLVGTILKGSDGYVESSVTPITRIDTINSQYYINKSNAALMNYYGVDYHRMVVDGLENAARVFQGTTAMADAYVSGVLTRSKIEEMRSYNNKVITDSTGKVYAIRVKMLPNDIHKNSSIPSGGLYNAMASAIAQAYPNQQLAQGVSAILGSPTQYTFTQITTHPAYVVEVTELVYAETHYEIGSGRYHTEDAAFDMFCLPCGRIEVRDQDNYYRVNKDMALAVARQIQVDGGDGIYDLQLLPYCPVPDLISGYNQISVYGIDASRYERINDPDTEQPLTYIFYPTKSTFSFDITFGREVKDANNPLAVKVDNDCRKYRFCSPNYSNYFEFSVAKNGGFEFVNVDCAYKPYSPYIHINPNFKNLYGKDFNDPRGLVLGGDFSLTQISNAWANYQIQNKYFQDIFDRQIENLDFNNSIARQQDIWGMIGGAASAGGIGAMAGSVFGVPGMIAGGLGAAAISGLAGGVGDMRLNRKMREEARDYTIDNFGYQLQTIKALPNTLSKISAFNPNNKVFPVLEIYDCSPEEREIYVNKLIQDGMTVMATGKISDYISQTTYSYKNMLDNGFTRNVGPTRNFIRCELIHFQPEKLVRQVAISNHALSAIKNELRTGVYWKL